MQECRVCHEIKEFDQFSMSTTNRTNNGYRTICKPCASAATANYYTKKSGGRKRVSKNSYTHLSPEQKELLSKLKYLCTKARGRKWPVTIDMMYLQEVYDSQQGLCRYTGLPLNLEVNHSTTISLDRIDSKLGYLQGNVQLVCSMVNRMKQEFSEVEFLKFCTLIADKLR